MGLFGLFKGVGKQKLKDVEKSLSHAIVSWDPEAASEAQIEEMDNKFRSLSLKVEEARQDYDKEQKEAIEARLMFDRKRKAAQVIQSDLATLEGEAKEQTEEALNGLIDELEELKPEVEAEEKEAVEAKAWLTDLEGDLKTFAAKLKQARKQLESGRKSMQRAERTKDKAEEKAQQASERAGIRKQADAFDDVLGIMGASVQKAEAEANAAEARAKLLGGDSKQNDIVAKAMSRSTDSAPKKSVTDRLSAL